MSHLTEEQAKRAMKEMIHRAGTEGLEEEDIFKGVEQLDELFIQATLWLLWEKGELSIGWNIEESTIGFYTSDT